MQKPLLLPCLLMMASFGAAAQSSFDRAVLPFLTKNCNGCHNEKLSSGSLNLAQFKTAASVAPNRERWELLLKRLKAGEMPPPPMPRPNSVELRAVTGWIEGELDRLDRAAPP